MSYTIVFTISHVFRYGDKAVCVKQLEKVTASTRYIIGHPEDFLDKVRFKQLKTRKFNIVGKFVDEAHCAVMWHEDFRPDYGEIYKLNSIFPNAPTIALTGSATKEMRKAIAVNLRLKNHLEVITTVDRPNINISFKKRTPSSSKCTIQQSYEEVMWPLIQELARNKTSFPKTIVYAKLKWVGYCDEMTGLPEVDEAKQHSSQYHAPMSEEVWKKNIL